ncbi:MAG: T9SS C-terminal target domain-containing protein [Calditrichaeota bacterium]|nr:MAG: T9SS C-terminal target domain-containing protein [Calditrichota bacterium]
MMNGRERTGSRSKATNETGGPRVSSRRGDRSKRIERKPEMNEKSMFVSLAGIFVICLLTGGAAAQTRIASGVIGNGGATMSGGSMQLAGTVGQPAAGRSSGQANTVSSGFWGQSSNVVTDVAGPGVESPPLRFRLYQNHPNPFNPATTIRYALPAATGVRLTVHDLVGRTVRVLVAKTQRAGEHSVVWDGRDERGRQLASGVYVYRLDAGRFTKSAKMLLLK